MDAAILRRMGKEEPKVCCVRKLKLIGSAHIVDYQEKLSTGASWHLKMPMVFVVEYVENGYMVDPSSRSIKGERSAERLQMRTRQEAPEE